MKSLPLEKITRVTTILTIGSLLFALNSFNSMAAAQSKTGVDIDSLGPQVGDAVPRFELSDQNGNLQSLDSILGPNGGMLLFHRSADW
ncbi:MAG: hypothetical protein CMQ41_15140 [Gammaproteobacteria bacterium]|nr:hypothetical protein [Gammaproteobacteria bacterium]